MIHEQGGDADAALLGRAVQRGDSNLCRSGERRGSRAASPPSTRAASKEEALSADGGGCAGLGGARRPPRLVGGPGVCPPREQQLGDGSVCLLSHPVEGRPAALRGRRRDIRPGRVSPAPLGLGARRL